MADFHSEHRLLEEAVASATKILGLDTETSALAAAATRTQAEYLLSAVPEERRRYKSAIESWNGASLRERQLSITFERQERRLQPQILLWVVSGCALYWLAAVIALPDSLSADVKRILLLAPFLIGGAASTYYVVSYAMARLYQRRLTAATLDARQAESDCFVWAHRLSGALAAEIVPGFIATVANSVFSPDYSTTLQLTGTTNVVTPESTYYTRTREAAHLADMLKRMPGGSIGLSGPRGAGKTALIETYAADSVVLDSDSGKYLSVAVSAPVDYDAREFILHLFAVLCERVLTVSGKARSTDRLADSAMRLEAPPKLASFNHLALTGTVALLVGTTGLLANWLLSAIPLAINPLSTTATWATLFGLVALLISTRQRRVPNVEAVAPSLADRARDLLDGIRFQQTYTVGWGGTLKLPLAESQRKSDMAITRASKTIPELVQEYRRFAADVAAAHGKLLVTIDEMDKIRDANDAEAFLNQLKAVFGIPRVFFIVSVSEDALVGFERRGFSRRDVFDSAFDEVLSLHHLDWHSARHLATRRVIGVPVPFIGLSYAVSGGLPRDLVRILRRVANLHSDHPGVSIGEAAHQFCKSELAAKARATAVLLQGVTSVRREVSAALSDLFLIGETADQASLRASIGRLHAAVQSVPWIERDSIPQSVIELTCYGYYCVTLLDFFTDDRGYSVACPPDASVSSGTVQELVAALNELARNPGVCWERVSTCRKHAGAPAWDFPLSSQ